MVACYHRDARILDDFQSDFLQISRAAIRMCIVVPLPMILSEFQRLDRDRQREALKTLIELGASVRQLQRLTGLGRGLIQRI